ncbi:cupin domain-containing protein [Bacillus sp. S/N-304-OC-R1]|uniref:cupin domain-containing protein n=1 Tax=Bacillus sp. S/N-304-OC-R1 TaxID=2758034 RepID=UPI001C8DD990|nr:cupin domain-containing protein [Bacillus sp. S/N-304-OC-R1]MBY0123177.1 cupin domain-containing protein [Bacillus sp. S/N-304-OC-R1]
MIQGKMKVALGEDEIFLQAGDSIYFQSSTPHRYVNVGEEKVVSLWVMKEAEVSFLQNGQ